MRSPLLALSLCVMLASLGTSIANVALPTLAEDFGASFLQVRWVVLAYLLSLTAFAVLAGKLGDRIGRLPLLRAGLAVFTLASAAGAAAPSLAWLTAARAVQGAGAAAMAALSLALVAQWVPRERMGRAMGWLGSMSAIGTAVGPAVGGALVGTLGWRAIFVLLPALGGVGLIATYAARAARGQTARQVATAASRSLSADPRNVAGLVANVLVSAVVMATLVVGPFHLAGPLSLSAAVAGFVMAAGPIAAALTGAPAGRLVDRLGVDRVAQGGLVAIAIGSVLLAVLPVEAGIPGYVLALVIITVGYASFQAANNTALVAGACPADRGRVSGALNLSRNVGLIAGAWLMAKVFAWASSSSIVAGTRGTFLLAAVLSGAAMAAMAIGNRKPVALRAS